MDRENVESRDSGRALTFNNVYNECCRLILLKKLASGRRAPRNGESLCSLRCWCFPPASSPSCLRVIRPRLSGEKKGRFTRAAVLSQQPGLVGRNVHRYC